MRTVYLLRLSIETLDGSKVFVPDRTFDDAEAAEAAERVLVAKWAKMFGAHLADSSGRTFGTAKEMALSMGIRNLGAQIVTFEVEDGSVILKPTAGGIN